MASGFEVSVELAAMVESRIVIGNPGSEVNNSVPAWIRPSSGVPAASADVCGDRGVADVLRRFAGC